MELTIHISDDDAVKFAEVGKLEDASLAELGRLRIEYTQRERALMGALDELSAERESLIRAFSRTYLKDVPPGTRWSFDPAQRAFVQQGVQQ